MKIDGIDIDIKPCAHCGGEDIRKGDTAFYIPGCFRIMCWTCGIQTQHMPNGEAVSRWNKRFGE